MSTSVEDRAAGPGAGGPALVGTLDDLSLALRTLRAGAGAPSYSEIVRRVAAVRARRGVPAPERTPGRITVYDCFRTGRRRMDAELLSDVVRALGADPAPWRLALHRALAGPPAAVPVLPAGPGPGPLAGWPADCPGRARELARLTGAEEELTVIAGMPGVGKTHLALCAARRMPGRGSRLYAALRGHDPASAPADPHAVLGSLLRALGVPDQRVRRLDPAGRRTLYRRVTAERAALVVLDDAAEPPQVRELLPGPGARVLVTTRRDMPALGAPALTLRPLTPPDSLTLLARALGEERLRSEPQAAARIADLCGQLPLQLTVTAQQITQRPGWSLTDHAHRLRAAPDSPALLAALQASYQRLDAPAQRMFQLLGLHPGGVVTPAAAAALAAWPAPSAADALERLRSHHLLRRVRHPALPLHQSGYALHQAVRRHARRSATENVPHSAQQAAIARLTALARPLPR